MKELVAMFHCDKCGKETKLIDTIPEEEKDMHCPYCGSNGRHFYSYDDYYVERTEKTRKY